MTPNSSPAHQKNFLASLFDFGFTSFVTLRFLKIIYAIVVVLTLLSGLSFLVVGLSAARGAQILLVIVLAPLVTLVYLIFARILFEVIALFFRIGDNTTLAVQLLGGGQPGRWAPAAQPGYGPPPDAGGQSAQNPQWGYGAAPGDPSLGATTVTQYGAPPSGYPQSPGQQGQYPQSPGQQGQYPQSPSSQPQYPPPSQAQYAPPPQPSTAAYAQPSQAPTAQYSKPSEGQYSKPSDAPYSKPSDSDSQGQPGQQSDTPPQPGQERWGQSPNP
jgi:hypothetical protein